MTKIADQLVWPQWPRYDDETVNQLNDVLASGRWSISGPSTGQNSKERIFANKFAAYNNISYCTPLSSGTAALIVSLLALEIGPGMEVIVPGLTCVACALAVKNVGAIPVPADIDQTTLAISVSDTKSKISSRTAAIIIVHPYCNFADIEGFLAISFLFNIPIIEDCAQAHGSKFKGKMAGTFGVMGCFSFQTGKTLTAGEGGAIITNDQALYERVEELRAHGRYFSTNSNTGNYELIESGNNLGQNFCMSEFQAAILIDRLNHLDYENQLRIENMKFLANELIADGNLNIIFPITEESPPSYSFLIGLNEMARKTDVYSLQYFLSNNLKLFSETVYRPLTAHPLSKKLLPSNQEFELPESELVFKLFIAIPHFYFLTDKPENLKALVSALKNFFIK